MIGHHQALGFDFTVTSDLDVDLTPWFATFEPAAPPTASASSIRLRQADDDFFELVLDDRIAFRTLDLGVLIHQTVWEITRRAVASVPDAVVLHAAVVVVDGTQVVVSGESGAGKSTLTTSLLALGGQYRTDEAVVLEPDGRLGAAIRRPIQLSARSLAMLGLDHAVSVRLPDGSAYLPVPHTGEPTVPHLTDEVAIVVLDGHADTFDTRRTRRSELVATLVRESFAGHAITQRGLETVKNLSSRSRWVALRGGTVAERANAARNVAHKP